MIEAKVKVIFVGLHKTGTTSLIAAMGILGYKANATAKHRLLPAIKQNDWEPVFFVADRFDALKDSPWQKAYKQLDAQYPGSKFVLSIRDEESWIKSMVNYFGSFKTKMRGWIYGAACPKGNEELYIKAYRAHNKEVLDYFRHRPEDLLVIDMKKDLGWEKLCQFLGTDVPSQPFPYKNRGEYRVFLRPIKRGLELFKKIFSDEIFLFFS